MIPFLLASRWLWFALAAVALFVAGWYSGYDHERKVFMEFKSQVEAQGREAERIAKETEARHEEAKTEIEQEYKERLANLQRRYADSLRKSGGSQVSRTTDPARRVDEAAANSSPYFVEQCAETTLQLIELQQWVKRTYK
jgi:hypothetical protein